MLQKVVLILATTRNKTKQRKGENIRMRETSYRKPFVS